MRSGIWEGSQLLSPSWPCPDTCPLAVCTHMQTQLSLPSFSDRLVSFNIRGRRRRPVRVRPGQDPRMLLGASRPLKSASGFSTALGLPAKPAAIMAHRDREGVPPSPDLGGLSLGTFLVHRGNLCWPHPEHQGEAAQAIWPSMCG